MSLVLVVSGALDSGNCAGGGSALRVELWSLTLKDVRKRAIGVGMSTVALEEAMVADDSKEEIISFILQTNRAVLFTSSGECGVWTACA